MQSWSLISWLEANQQGGYPGSDLSGECFKWRSKDQKQIRDILLASRKHIVTMWTYYGGGYPARTEGHLLGAKTNLLPTARKKTRVSVIQLQEHEFCQQLRETGSELSLLNAQWGHNLARTLQTSETLSRENPANL